MKSTIPKRSKGRPRPELVKVGGVIAKIYRSDTEGYASWLVRYFVDKKPKSLRATSLEDARTKAKRVLKSVSAGSAHVETFTPRQAANVSAAVERLREVGVPLLDAIADFVAARKILPPKWSVADAARGFAAYKEKEEKDGAGPEPMKFRKAVEKFHERNERRGLSEGYRNDCRKHLTIIGKTFDEAIIQNLLQPELTACLEASTEGGARRFNNLRGTLNALFGFCQKEGILPRDRAHEAALIEKKEERNAESIAIYTPKEMQVILANIGDELLPWALLGGFAGLRVSEIHRLSWENIRLDAGFITLDKAFTKTKRRRVIPICDALRAWIEPVTKDKSGTTKSGLIYPMPYKTYEDRVHKGWMKMTDAKGKLLVKKRTNALRHSYGTYRFAILQDEFKVSAEMGNSPSELRASYAELALPKDAEAWFSIMPEQAENVVKMPKDKKKPAPKAKKRRAA
jgi:integrase